MGRFLGGGLERSTRNMFSSDRRSAFECTIEVSGRGNVMTDRASACLVDVPAQV